MRARRHLGANLGQPGFDQVVHLVGAQRADLGREPTGNSRIERAWLGRCCRRHHQLLEPDVAGQRRQQRGDIVAQ